MRGRSKHTLVHVVLGLYASFFILSVRAATDPDGWTPGKETLKSHPTGSNGSQRPLRPAARFVKLSGEDCTVVHMPAPGFLLSINSHYALLLSRPADPAVSRIFSLRSGRAPPIA